MKKERIGKITIKTAEEIRKGERKKNRGNRRGRNKEN